MLNNKLAEEVARINQETGSDMSTDFSDLFYMIGDRYGINAERINNLPINDEFKKLYSEETLPQRDKIPNEPNRPE